MGLNFPSNPKNADLKLVVESENYEEDLVKSQLEVIVTERIEIVDKENELQKLELQNKSKISNEASSAFIIVNEQNLSKLMEHFDGTGDISVYLALRETNISKMNIEKEIELCIC